MAALLPALLCGGGMILCFFFMNRMHGHTSGSEPTSSDRAPTDDVTALREEVGKLRAELRSRDQQELPS
jgi:hypothetical protein